MKTLPLSVPLLAALVAVPAPATTIAADREPDAHVTIARERVAPTEFRGDLRLLPKAAAADAARLKYERPVRKGPDSRRLPASTAPTARAGAIGPSAPMPAALANFPGISAADTCTGGKCGAGWPPDTNGDVGPNHYIQAVNQSFAIFSKSGTRLAAFTEDQLWSTAGASPCNGNSQGDPIVVYDAQADRWILTQFAFALSGSGDPVSPFYQCFAVSKSGDPVGGGWYFYALRMDPGGPGLPPVGALNDYGKFGIWNDCLYMAANEFRMPQGNFAGTLYGTLNRADLYAGAPLTWSVGFVNDSTGPFTMIPANLSGRAYATLPPGTPNYFVSESTTDFAYEVRTFIPDTTCGGGGVLSSPVVVPQASYDFNLPNASQPNTSNTLDNVGDRLLQKVQYRKVGAKESLWVMHNVQTGGGRLAPQWGEIDVTGGVVQTTLKQGGTFAPDNALHRWMGSLAVDAMGNMAMGYSTSGNNAPDFPSIAYAGRLAGDPPGTLPQAETQLVAGLGSQTNTCGGAPCDRWGDYSAMSVDPVDDCTFWYTNQYYSSQANGTLGNWQTRVGAFKFASCSSLPPSTTVVTSSLNPAFALTAVTFTAAVTGAAPSGTVAFSDGGTPIAGCAAVALAGTGNTRSAQCTTSALAGGSHVIGAAYAGDAGNAPSAGNVTQTISTGVPGTATVVTNPYGAMTVTGATLVGTTISNFQCTSAIQMGPVAGTPGVAAEIDVQGLNIGPNCHLDIRPGAAGQKVILVDTGGAATVIAGTLGAPTFVVPTPVALSLKNRNGLTVPAGGIVAGFGGLTVDTLGTTPFSGQSIVNEGFIIGESSLEMLAAAIHGGGEFRGDAITLRTFGNANNPVNGSFFLQNGLRLRDSTGAGTPQPGKSVAVTVNNYGTSPQFINLNIQSNGTLWMPSAWPGGSTALPNQQVVMPGGLRAAGVPDPAYGAGSIIVQSSGTLALVDGGTADLVFPGGIVLKAGTSLDFNGVRVDQGWTTSGQPFQGLFFESPVIGNSKGLIQLYSNNLNWSNFSTFPTAFVRAFTLQRNPNGSAGFAAADGVAPHLNTYSVLIDAAAKGQCWTCLQNTQPVNMFGP